MYKDEISKPVAGRYFPFPPAELIQFVRQLGFEVDGASERLPLIMQNCDVICDLGHQVASFYRQGYLASFSLPDAVPEARAKAATEKSIQEFHRIDKSRNLSLPDQSFVVYRSYLGPLGLITITSDIIQAQHRWYLQYRKAAKISKGQLKRRNERTIAKVQLN